MHLKQLKLAGFKSFVEPTVVPFSSQLVAVVGPNGCGKSNIIDAVRWVMGESSAKNLRGESMADVIFNGSSNRKSIGQASVELVFDNSLGRLTGQYASYQEIAVKRLVTRDGDSFYFLNGSRCRRRDITDIFLGTGAGARGYSIIGQDTISRLIEARPEDLRAYLEEAAGVSKYKERRRETLQRIGQTRDNLVRVADIRDELGKQLLRLERQAKAAERYKSLKQDERLCKAEIIALKWHALTTEQAQVNGELTTLSLQYEQHRSKITALIKDSVYLREKLHIAQGDFQQTQLKFYQLNTEIARLEENIQQQQREKQRLTDDKQQIQADLQTAVNQLQQDNEALISSERALDILQAKVQLLSGDLKEQQQALDDNEQKKVSWEIQWQTAQTALNQVKGEVQVEQVRLQHVEQRFQQTQLRFEKTQGEQASIIVDSLQTELSVLQIQQIGLAKQQLIDAENHQNVINKGIELRQQLIEIERQLHQAHDKVQALVTEQAALLAAQNAVLRNAKTSSSALLQWENNPRLAEVISVPDKWLRACEHVLGESLHAIVLDSTEVLMPTLVELQGRAAVFVQQAQTSSKATSYPRLSDLVQGVMPCWFNALDQVFAADSLEEAIAWLPTIKSHQSVVTADGYWLGQGWVKIDGCVDHDESGLLLRQQALTNLNEVLVIEQDNLSALQVSRDQMHVHLVENETKSNELKHAVSISYDELQVCETQINHKKQVLEHALIRLSALSEENEELQLAIEDLATQKINIERKWQANMDAVTQLEPQLQLLIAAKTSWADTLLSSRRATDGVRDALHQAELQCNRETLKAQQLHDSIKRAQQHVDTLQNRLDVLADRYNELTAPDKTQSTLLNEKLMLHHQLDEELGVQRQRVEELQNQLNESERVGKQEEQQANTVQDKIQQEQLHEQGLSVRASSLLESLSELSADVDVLLSGIPTHVTLQAHEKTLIDFDDKIKRLGAINLMAIEEYQTELERKEHLDGQYMDLMEALATLDTAIAKMDKETQLRLKDTFDQVNASFQALFPRLFGGGNARLELTCDNLLDAGILVMAQPPGKRNSSIHLLSGGEKAMTAVALVFAIFQLNPSPFCMLDEVDAPLDDLNVKRFCELVKEMSQFVQFLFITHNKVTMELAEHLIGVTMREPGVSRVVTVDVEEALSIAE